MARYAVFAFGCLPELQGAEQQINGTGSSCNHSEGSCRVSQDCKAKEAVHKTLRAKPPTNSILAPVAVAPEWPSQICRGNMVPAGRIPQKRPERPTTGIRSQAGGNSAGQFSAATLAVPSALERIRRPLPKRHAQKTGEAKLWAADGLLPSCSAFMRESKRTVLIAQNSKNRI